MFQAEHIVCSFFISPLMPQGGRMGLKIEYDTHEIDINLQGPLLLTCINCNPNIDD